MLGTRLVIGFSMVGFLVAVLVVDNGFAPYFPFWLVLSLVATGAAAVEIVNLFSGTEARASGATVVPGALAVVLSNWAPHLVNEMHRLPHTIGRYSYDPLAPVNALAWPFLTFVAVVMVAFLAESARFEKPGGSTAAIAGTVLAVAYIGLLGSFVVQMRWFEGPYYGLIPLVFLFATAKGADTGAYTLGRIAGRHKLWPRLSPNKTVEGAIGGLLFAVAFALTASAIARLLLHAPALGWRQSVVFGLIVGTAAQLGDLMESMLKRDGARKDASAAVPGFGGVLDVIDSLLFAGPVAYGFWLWAGV